MKTFNYSNGIETRPCSENDGFTVGDLAAKFNVPRGQVAIVGSSRTADWSLPIPPGAVVSFVQEDRPKA